MNVTGRPSVLDGVTRNPVAVTVTCQVVPRREADVHSRGWAVLRATAQQPGFLGGGVLVDSEAERYVIHRFEEGEPSRAWKGGTRSPGAVGGTCRGAGPGGGATECPRFQDLVRRPGTAAAHPAHPARAGPAGEMEVVVRE